MPSSAILRDEPPPPPPIIEAIPPAGYSRQPNTTVDSTAESATSPTIAASDTATESAPTETPVTDQAKLIVDVKELYQEYPDDCEEDDRIPEDIIVKAADFKKVKHNDGTYSYLIFCECLENGIGVTKKGWISDSDSKLKKISAYNWEEFGFKVIIDNQDELIYTPDAPPQFLKDVWKQIDADCNNVLTEQELRYALKNKRISEKLSHLVCLHTSEWSYKESKLSSLKSKLNTLFDVGIKEEEDAACKQELKDKKKAVLEAMEQRVKDLSWWGEVTENALFGNNPFAPGTAKPEKKEAENPAAIPFAPEEELKGPTLFPVSNPKVYHFHPLAFVRQMRRMDLSCDCGKSLNLKYTCVKYSSMYGPLYYGSKKLADFEHWNDLIQAGKLTQEDKILLCAMSENEGNLDSVQSYDSEIATVGAMQKTINSKGSGELSRQIWEFKQEYPDKYEMLFLRCGWTVEPSDKNRNVILAFYKDPHDTSSKKISGGELKEKIRDGFNSSSYRKKIICPPLDSLVNASLDPDFQTKQVMDFIDRLSLATNQVPVKSYSGSKLTRNISEFYSYKIKDFIKSNLGKGLILDHHINRPAYPIFDLGSALNFFFNSNPNVSKNPSSWGNNHQQYEEEILSIYGPNRDMTDAKNRYDKLKEKL